MYCFGLVGCCQPRVLLFSFDCYDCNILVDCHITVTFFKFFTFFTLSKNVCFFCVAAANANENNVSLRRKFCYTEAVSGLQGTRD